MPSFHAIRGKEPTPCARLSLVWTRMRRSCPMRCRLQTKRAALRRLRVQIGLGILFVAGRSAWGGPSAIGVRLKCPQLTEAEAAEFEARAKVDLSARSA